MSTLVISGQKPKLKKMPEAILRFYTHRSGKEGQSKDIKLASLGKRPNRAWTSVLTCK